LGHDELVGVKFRCQPARLGREPLRNRLGLVRREVVEHDMDLKIARQVQVDEAKEVEHLF
jgi:hypothetical protein